MEYFPYRDGELYAEQTPVSEIAARHGTPCYIYSRSSLEAAFSEYRDALAGRHPHLVQERAIGLHNFYCLGM